MRVLVIEDDAAFREAYATFLAQQGYDAMLVGSREETLQAWKPGAFDVVLLDKKLQGQLGPDDGVALIRELEFFGARVFLVTGYADEASIRQAFDLGAFEYLEKGPLLFTLLKVKLAQVYELLRAQQSNTKQGERAILDLWGNLGAGTSQEKGRRLEDLILRLFNSVPDFVVVSHHLRTPAEEIDIAIRNESKDPLWTKQSSYFLVECKNWSKKVGSEEVAWVAEKLRRRRVQAQVGFFFAPEGFTTPVDEEVRRYRAEGLQLVLVERNDLQDLVNRPAERNDILKRLHAHWALA